MHEGAATPAIAARTSRLLKVMSWKASSKNRDRRDRQKPADYGGSRWRGRRERRLKVEGRRTCRQRAAAAAVAVVDTL